MSYADMVDEVPEGYQREGETWYHLEYRCPNCGFEWHDEWSCAVDDDCGICGTRHISPVTAEEIE